MTRATKQLSGPGKDKFFKRFFAEEDGLKPDVAEKLASKSSETFSSVRVRGPVFDAYRAAESAAKKPRPVAKSEPPKKSKAKKPETSDGEADKAPAPAAPKSKEETGSFDPFAIGLVPTFQREGAEGLMSKLEDVDRVDDLRQMAKSQRIVIPRELRSGEPAPAAVREAIVAAVQKSIGDKASAAGPGR